MTDRRSSKPKRTAPERWTRDGERFVMIPETDYDRLCELAANATDLRDLKQARAENAGDKLVA